MKYKNSYIFIFLEVFINIHKMSLKQKFAKQVKLGLGVITSMNIIQMKKVVEKGLKKNKNFLCRYI